MSKQVESLVQYAELLGVVPEDLMVFVPRAIGHNLSAQISYLFTETAGAIDLIKRLLEACVKD